MRRLFWPACFLLAAGRLWLGFDLPLSAQWLRHDDTLFIQHASHIANGNWLGPYDDLTLVKPPGFPLFIAATHRLGVPLLFAEQLLYVLAGLLLVLALGRIVPSRPALLLVLALYLFSPASFMGEVYAVKRAGLYPSSVTLVLAALAWTLGVARRNRAGAAGAGLALGVAFALANLLRDESTWLLPSTVLILAAAALRAPTWRETAVRLVILVTMAIAPTALGTMLVARANNAAYGVSTTSELTHSSTRHANRQLLRAVSARERRPYVPLPETARARIYSEVPAFAELQDRLESPGEWTAASCQHVPDACNDIAGAWIWWAIRDAAAKIGKHKTAIGARDFYQRIGDETQVACNAGRLSCTAPTDGLLLGVEFGAPREVVMTAARGLAAMVAFSDVELLPAPSETRKQFVRMLLPRYRKMTGQETLSTARGSSPPHTPPDPAMAVRQALLRSYQAAIPVLFVIAVGAFIWDGLRALATPRSGIPNSIVVSAALLGATLALLVGLAILDGSAFPALLPRYLAPGYPPLLIFTGVGTARAASLLLDLRGSSPASPVEPTPEPHSR